MTEPMTSPARITALRALVAAGTPGEWRTVGARPHGIAIGPELPYAAGDCHLPPDDLMLVVATQNALPEFLDEHDRLARRVAELEEALRPFADIVSELSPRAQPWEWQAVIDTVAAERILTVGDFRAAAKALDGGAT